MAMTIVFRKKVVCVLTLGSVDFDQDSQHIFKKIRRRNFQDRNQGIQICPLWLMVAARLFAMWRKTLWSFILKELVFIVYDSMINNDDYVWYGTMVHINANPKELE